MHPAPWSAAVAGALIAATIGAGPAGYATGRDARLLTAFSQPALLTVAGSGAKMSITHVELPRDQHLAADIDRLFPPELRPALTSGGVSTTPTERGLLDLARARP